MSAMTENQQELGPLLQDPVPLHFVGGPWCGLTRASRMAGEVRVHSEEILGRVHVYRRIGTTKDSAEVVMHREIRDDGRPGAR